jgi:hypothetical protein
MAKGKSKSRSLSKSEREIITYQRVANMSSYIEVLDKRIEAIADDIGLLIALAVSNDEQRAKMVEAIQASISENGSEEG